MNSKRSWLSAALGIVLAGLAPVYAQTSGWVNVRNINTSMDVQNATDGTLVNASWKQAESVNWYHRATLGGQSFPLTSSNLLIKLEIFDTDQSILYLTSTGSIYNASGGQMLFSLSPDDSNLIEDEYRGYISLYQTNGATVVNMGVLAVSRVTVEYSANSGNYTFIGNDIENVRSNAVYELVLGSPITTGLISRTQSSTGASYLIRFPAPNSIGTDVTARAAIDVLEGYTGRVVTLEGYTSRVVGVEAYTGRVVTLEGYTSRVVGVEAYTGRVVTLEGYTSRVAAIENTYSNNVRGGYFGSYTQDVVIGTGSARGTGLQSSKLTFTGSELVDGIELASIFYHPFGDNDLWYFEDQAGNDFLFMSNRNIRVERMTNGLDGVYLRQGAGADATNAVASLSYTGAVIGAVTFAGGGITQTDRVFNLDGFAEDADLAAYYPANNPSNFIKSTVGWWTNAPTANVNLGNNSITNVQEIADETGAVRIDVQSGSFEGNWDFHTAVSTADWAVADSTTNCQTMTGFNSWTTAQGVVNALVSSGFVELVWLNSWTSSLASTAYVSSAIASATNWHQTPVPVGGYVGSSVYKSSSIEFLSERQFVSIDTNYMWMVTDPYQNPYMYIGNSATGATARVYTTLDTMIATNGYDASAYTNFPSSLRTISQETAYNTNNTKTYTWSSMTASQVLNYGSVNIVGITNLVIGADYPTGTNKVWFQGVLNVQP